MPYLICYDIEDNRLRNKTATQLAYYGLLRIQKSVFIGPMKQSHLHTLQKWFEKKLVPHLQPDDRISILRIGNQNFAGMQHLKSVPNGWDELIDPPPVLIF